MTVSALPPGRKEMTWKDHANRLLDSLPGPVLSPLGRQVPTFRTCGIAGYYVALLVLFGGGLLTGRSMPILAVLAAVSGLSFFAYTYVRMWITGREELVLLEHVWFAFACNTATLLWMHEPVLPYLDLISVAICPFLAAGRVGCTLVGCCHGRPSSFGITYNEECVRDGFSRHLVGVRLFPVPAVEAAGLLAIGAIGVVALPFAQPGKVFSWYLLAYSVLRFGLEGIRGDHRPHCLGLSQARWMAIIEVALALDLTAGEHRAPAAVLFGILLAVLIGALWVRRKIDLRGQLLAPVHVHELREWVRGEIDSASNLANVHPIMHKTKRQITVAISTSRPGARSSAHISLSLPEGYGDLPSLCELAALAFPELLPEEALFTQGRILHVMLPLPLGDRGSDSRTIRQRVDQLYGPLVRKLQCDRASLRPHLPEQKPIQPMPVSDRVRPSIETDDSKRVVPWYFADVGKPKP